MAAPQTAYLRVDASFRGTNNLTMVVNPAKATDDLATLKDRFYLDDVIGFKAVYQGVEYHGFWGTCIRGGTNEAMHRGNRHLDIFTNRPGMAMRTFNDAGLNTLGFAVITGIRTIFANRSKLYVNYKSSWYSFSNAMNIQYSVNNGPFAEGYDDSTLPQRQSVSKLTTIDPGAQLGDLIRARPYIDNEEGRFYGAEYVYIAGDRINEVDFILKSSACSEDNTNAVGVWMTDGDLARLRTLTENSIADGPQGFKDDELTVPIDNGYYAGSSDRVYFAQGGRFQRYEICDNGGGTDPGSYDINIYCDYDENGTITVIVNLTTPKAYDVTVQGRVAAFNQTDNEIGGGTGSGFFTVVVPAGSPGDGQPTQFVPPSNAAYVMAVNITVNPAGLTYLSLKS